MNIKFPDITVELSGQDGNVFGIIGKVRGALKRVGEQEAAAEYQRECLNADDFDHVIQITMRYVEVE